MFEKILIATDGSVHSERAVEVGVELAKLSGGSVTAVYVADTSRISHLPDDMLLFGIKDLLVREGQEAVGHAEGLAAKAGVAFQNAVLEGNPGEEILKYAEGSGTNVIVMGSVGRTGLDKFLLGSVAEKVVRNSRVPVLTVPREGA
jgi:nucleotide-binding universal stress UspA family protein